MIHRRFCGSDWRRAVGGAMLATLLSPVALFGAEPGASAAAESDNSVPAGPGLFVAVGYGGFRGWSADGEHWTAERWSEKNADDVNVIFSVTYRAGVFLCSGGGSGKGFILRSTDGKTWQEVVQTRWRVTGVLALDDRFLSAFNDHIQTSTDGLTWQEQSAAKLVAPDGVGGGYFRRWSAGNGMVVFAGDYELGGGKPRIGWLAGTKNGATPLKLQMQESDVRGLDFAKGRFVACTLNGTILVSTSGDDFGPVGMPTGDIHDDNCVRFFDGQFYLRGRKSVRSSPDGEQWTTVEKPPHIPQAVSPAGVAIDSGWGGIQVAPDGRTWTKAPVPIDPTGITAVVYGVPLAGLPKEK